MLIIKKFPQKHPLIFCGIFSLVFATIKTLFFIIKTTYFKVNIPYFLEFFKIGLDFLILILTVIMFKCFKILKCSAKSFKESFKGTSILFILAFILLFLTIFKAIQEKEEFTSGFKILLGVLKIFTSAFTEEIVFRGVLANFLSFKHAQTKKGAYFSIFFPSFIFAAMHFVNITTGAKIFAVSFQVINALFFGVLITTVYFKYNHNIWVVSFLHTIINFSGLFKVYFLKKNISFADTFNKEKIIETLGYRFILMGVIIFICYLYLRKNAIEKIISNINNFKNNFYGSLNKKS